MINSIVALNDAASNTDFDGTWSGNNNIVGDDPGFTVAPVFEDGVLVNAGELDFSLAAGSAAIDAGASDAVETEVDIAGNPRIVGGIVDLGAYEYQGTEPKQLTAPMIITGNSGIYVSYGANRHQIQWNIIENASSYELQFSADGNSWTTVSVTETVAVITGLTYGRDVQYRVRALGDGLSYTDSDWSAVKTFNVCPMDIDGDEFIGPGDNAVLSAAWFLTEEDAGWEEWCDIDGDGFIGPGDYSYLSSNWFLEAGDTDLVYPAPKAADTAFAEFVSADLDVDLDMF